METTESKYEHRHFARGRRPRAGWIILGIIGFAAFAFLLGAVVMLLWNWLMPVIFHLGVITYWQAVGLAILGRLLIGGFHHGPHHRGRHGCGPWGHRHYMHNAKYCGDYSNSDRWSHYDQFWNEEGEKAFDDYLKRKGEDNLK
jgi:hypothetical protein